MTRSEGRGRTHEFDAEQVVELLAELDDRLRGLGVGASIFVVGGAAIAATGARTGRLTADIDAVTRNEAVLEEARQLARERGLPENWLNSRAQMWMPPLPNGVLDEPSEPGLRATYADDGFLFATKLVAQRAKDVDDLIALAERLDLLDATPNELEAHLRRYYSDEANLEFIVGPSDTNREVALLAADAARVLNQAAAGVDNESGGRLQQSQAREQRNAPPSSRTPRSAPRR